MSTTSPGRSTTLVHWVPRLIIAAATVHVLLGLTDVKAFTAIASSGFVGSLIGHDDRSAAFWFVATGLVLLALGELARWAVRETGRLPARLGWWLIGIAVPVIAVMPISGALGIAAIGGLAVFAARRTPRPAVVAA